MEMECGWRDFVFMCLILALGFALSACAQQATDPSMPQMDMPMGGQMKMDMPMPGWRLMLVGVSCTRFFCMTLRVRAPSLTRRLRRC